MFLGQDLLAWLVLALGAALCVGNLLAVAKPPSKPKGAEDLAKAPLGRTITMAIVGGLAALWALASLIS